MRQIPNIRLTKFRSKFSIIYSLVLLIFLSYWLYNKAFIDPEVQKTVGWSNAQELSNILPIRGQIRSSDNEIYAQTREAYLFWVNPSVIKDPDAFSASISTIIGDKADKIANKIRIEAKSKREYLIIKRKILLEQKDLIIKKCKSTPYRLDYSFGFSGDLKREYPKGSVAAALIGFVGIDNNGLSGLEASYDEDLKGVPGKKINYNAFIGDQMPGSWNALKEKKDGDTIVLTIQHYLQTKVEAILEKHCKLWNATGGVAMVMNPKTGELLSIANYPSFDLEHWENFWDNKKYSNRAISMNYEPGSIFKPITACAALEEGFFNPETFYNCGRTISIGGYTIECERDHGKNQDLLSILRNSCNVAFAKIGQKLGRSFYDYAKRFNFGSQIRCGLLGQESGILPDPSIWSESSVSTMSFGQGLSVTPLQMICAYSAIVNDGIMMKPIIVKQVLNSQNIVKLNITPEAIKQVISKNASEKMILALQNVVEDSRSISNAKVDGISIGGKTGTAKQVTNGRYDNNKLVCSFIGFFPAENPQYVILVSIQEPDLWNGYEEAFGSTVSAPAFKEIAYWIHMNLEKK